MLSLKKFVIVSSFKNATGTYLFNDKMHQKSVIEKLISLFLVWLKISLEFQLQLPCMPLFDL